MGVGLLLITHNDIGASLLSAASAVLGHCPLKAVTVSIENTSDPELKNDIIKEHIRKLDSNSGILILTDMYGSTPSNIACRHVSDNIKAVSGLNLPMLVRVLNYPDMDLDKLILKATSGGIEGVMSCNKEN